MAEQRIEPGGNTYPLYNFYEEVAAYPLSDSLVFLIFVIITYFAFVLKIGPNYMKHRPAFSLRTSLLVYNGIQVALSILFVILTFRPILAAGLLPKKSAQFDPQIKKMMFFGVYIYFLGKLTELLDTIFFVLRKKDNQITFLHVYHHSSVVIGTWVTVFYSINMTIVYGCFINSVVHVVMYFYYFLSALGPEYQKYLTWKRHITTFQLVQFVSMFSHQVMSLFYTEGEHVIIGIVYSLYSPVLFFVLFSNFYKKSYMKNDTSKVQ